MTWIVELLNYDCEVAELGGHVGRDFNDNEFSAMAQEGDRLFVDYLAQAYRAFLSGDDDLCPPPPCLPSLLR